MPRDVVTLVNRTSKLLYYRFDGIDETLQPGDNFGIPRKHVDYAKQQNKQMGSEEFYNPNKFICLVGVKDSKDDCSPIEQTNAPQVIDREAKNRRSGQESKTVAADGPTMFDAMMPGSQEPASTSYAGSAGDGRPTGAARPAPKAARATKGRR